MYMAKHGDFEAIHDGKTVAESEIHTAGFILENFVLQFGGVRPDFGDPVYAAMFQELLIWCSQPWSTPALRRELRYEKSLPRAVLHSHVSF